MSNQPPKRSNPTPRDFAGDKNKRLSHDAKQSTNSTMGDDSDDDFDYNDDEFSEDEEVIIAGDDDEDNENENNEMGDNTNKSTTMNEGEDEQPRVWRHGIDKLKDDEVLEHDPAAYKVYETAQLEWPALSFDILKDASIGEYSTTYPVKLYTVTGTQTDKSHENKINVMMMENICETKDQDDDDGGFDLDGNDDNDTNESNLEPTLVSQSFLHPGCVNRIRSMPQNQSIVSTFSENGSVYIWNITPQLSYLNQQLLSPPSIDQKPLYSFQHGCEGYGLAWSTIKPSLASGDRNGNIFIHTMNPDGTSITTTNSKTPLTRNVANNWIEDIKWSPNEGSVFATVDTTGYLSIWHEAKSKSMISIQAHDTEINALSWNKHTQYLLATGDDNGVIKIWDLRYIKDPAVSIQGSYNFHQKAITSLQWHPHEPSMFVAGADDDSITVWDLSLEADVDEVAKESTGAQMIDYTIPGQLLFQHLGQKEVKEVMFHPQYPSLVLSSASNGIDIFRPSNLDVVLSNPNQQPSEQIPVD